MQLITIIGLLICYSSTFAQLPAKSERNKIKLGECISGGHFLEFYRKESKNKPSKLLKTDCFEMIGYERVTIIGKTAKSISLHFSSSFVVAIDLIIKFNDTDSNWWITSGEVYDPIRMDYDSKVEECSTSFKILLENFTEKIDTIQSQVLDNKQNCKYSYSISRRLDEIHIYYKTDDVNERYSGIGRIQAYLERYPLATNNLSKYNDIGYFLGQKGLFPESVYLLNIIITKFPDRTPAYINLGDAYWGLKDQIKAKKPYKNYIDLMKKSDKEAKIPKRVYDRIK
ncbi:MAG: hypothetical protein H7329_07225 [Opitutaceae bacterium]|nr:hypothetical protein [Cytophagales bacterium]